MISALTTVTIAAPDASLLAELFGQVLGWHCIARARIDAGLELHWGIAAGSAGAEYSLWQAGDVERGQVRLLQGGERPRLRPLTPRWAGIEMVVSRDIDGLYARLAAIPWLTTLQVPVTMDWSEFGSNQHRAFIMQGPGGTHLAFTMGLTKPVGRDFPATQAWAGHVFELPLVTPEFRAARAFYGEVLGMQPILTSSFERGLWHRIWKLPEPTAVQLDLLKGDVPGTGLGAIELTGYPAGVIDELPAAAQHFDGGTCLVTLSSDNIDALWRRVAGDTRARVVQPPQTMHGAGYDGLRTFCFTGLCDERVEVVAVS